jgi:hypothetical protein
MAAAKQVSISHLQPPGREQVAPVEYTVAHEVGHDVAADHPGAFKKFAKTAGWHDTTNEELQKEGATPDDLLDARMGTHVGNELVKRDDDGHLHAVDDTALPSFEETGTNRWKYAASNANEHFAELYAMAVETPELLYADYIDHPAARVRELEATVRDQKQALASLPPNGKEHAGLAEEIADNTRQLEHARKAKAQREELFSIIRNDVFHADKEQRAAEQRLRQRGATADQLQTFDSKAAQISTPKQMAQLEHEIMP